MTARRAVGVGATLLFGSALMVLVAVAQEKALSPDQTEKLNKCVQEATEGVKPEWGCKIVCQGWPPKCELVCG